MEWAGGDYSSGMAGGSILTVIIILHKLWLPLYLDYGRNGKTHNP